MSPDHTTVMALLIKQQYLEDISKEPQPTDQLGHSPIGKLLPVVPDYVVLWLNYFSNHPSQDRD
ncbi:hypothetical protein FF38_05898 [Lucilia cuprina]|uniref:Uncharacterized protein n=1 Tax=Lucilia cuprina TaxID=7375 RepID=A0A0L0C4R3_LUCCU|nr:hypothetical protein FF38_05898 [Lucilia cuprina]